MFNFLRKRKNQKLNNDIVTDRKYSQSILPLFGKSYFTKFKKSKGDKNYKRFRQEALDPTDADSQKFADFNNDILPRNPNDLTYRRGYGDFSIPAAPDGVDQKYRAFRVNTQLETDILDAVDTAKGKWTGIKGKLIESINKNSRRISKKQPNDYGAIIIDLADSKDIRPVTDHSTKKQIQFDALDALVQNHVDSLHENNITDTHNVQGNGNADPAKLDVGFLTEDHEYFDQKVNPTTAGRQDMKRRIIKELVGKKGIKQLISDYNAQKRLYDRRLQEDLTTEVADRILSIVHKKGLSYEQKIEAMQRDAILKKDAVVEMVYESLSHLVKNFEGENHRVEEKGKRIKYNDRDSGDQVEMAFINRDPSTRKAVTYADLVGLYQEKDDQIQELREKYLGAGQDTVASRLEHHLLTLPVALKTEDVFTGAMETRNYDWVIDQMHGNQYGNGTTIDQTYNLVDLMSQTNNKSDVVIKLNDYLLGNYLDVVKKSGAEPISSIAEKKPAKLTDEDVQDMMFELITLYRRKDKDGQLFEGFVESAERSAFDFNKLYKIRSAVMQIDNTFKDNARKVMRMYCE